MHRWLNHLAFVAKFSAFGLATAVVLWALFQRGVLPVPQAKATAPQDLRSLRASYAEAVDRAAPAVVNIYADRTVREQTVAWLRDPQLRQFAGRMIIGQPRIATKSELGSGVIIAPNGYILTNNHVIANADDIHVALWDGRVTEAQVVGTDQPTDLAVLKVELEQLPTLPFAQAEHLRIGDVVLAIGNPLGLGKTVTMGIVSATGRSDLNISTYENFIQTDAAINRGNSGGALINSAGQLVGVTTATLGGDNVNDGFGFAIPIDMAQAVMGQIVTHGQVIRGWLGVEMEAGRAYPEAGCPNPSAVVFAIYPNGPSHQAGVRPGDCITHFDGQQVATLQQLYQAIAATQPGTAINLTLQRQGQGRALTVVLAQRPQDLRSSS